MPFREAEHVKRLNSVRTLCGNRDSKAKIRGYTKLNLRVLQKEESARE